jgi:hypothetical protein
MRVCGLTWWGFPRRSFSGTATSAPAEEDLQAAPEFLFEQCPSSASCDDRTPGQPFEPAIRLVAAGRPPYRRVRREENADSRTEISALTIAASP